MKRKRWIHSNQHPTNRLQIETEKASRNSCHDYHRSSTAPCVSLTSFSRDLCRAANPAVPGTDRHLFQCDVTSQVATFAVLCFSTWPGYLSLTFGPSMAKRRCFAALKQTRHLLGLRKRPLDHKVSAKRWPNALVIGKKDVLSWLAVCSGRRPVHAQLVMWACNMAEGFYLREWLKLDLGYFFGHRPKCFWNDWKNICHFGQNGWKYRLTSTVTTSFNTTVRQDRSQLIFLGRGKVIVTCCCAYLLNMLLKISGEERLAGCSPLVAGAARQMTKMSQQKMKMRMRLKINSEQQET